MASSNMANSRKVLISNLPQNITSNEIIQELFESQNFKYNDIDFHGSSAIVTLLNANEARRAAKLINGQLFKGIRISVIEAPPPQKPVPSSGAVSPFLLLGNLSFDFTEKQFKDLMRPHGEIKNAFLVRGKISKKSKGYGFVEYNQTASATHAKEHFMKTDAKYIDGRAIRIESVSANVTTGEAKHSRSLFVDKLPKSFDDDEEIRNLFSTAGIVTYCKVARTKEGQPRGYALLDYRTVVEAEKGQEKLDGAQVGDSNIRVSFCPPGKTAEEKFSKFDTPNHRQPLLSVRPGMVVGPRGPRIHSLMPRNPGRFLNLGGVGGRPGFPPPGPLRTPFGIGGLPGFPRMQIMRPRPPILGPGPQLRVPVSQARLRTPGIRNGHPGVKPGQGVRKNRPNTRSGLVTSKPRPEKKPSGKIGESASKGKEVANDKKKDDVVEKNVAKETSKAAESQQPKKEKVDNAQPKHEEKPTTSVPDSATAEQKPDESAIAATTTLPSEGGEKDLQPVVFMDTEQLKQFRQFQELMKKGKGAEKSGESKSVSLEDLVKVANEENQKKTASETRKSEPSKSSVESKQSHDLPKPQKQGVSKQTSEISVPSKPETTKPSSAVSKSLSSSSKASPSSTKVSTATAKPSPLSTKATPPATLKPSPAPIKLSSSFGMSSSASDKHSSATYKPSPGTSKSGSVSKSSSVTTKPSVRPTQSNQQAVQRQERSTKPPHNSYQRPSQPQQRFQTENQRSHEREKNHHDRNPHQDLKSTTSVSRNDSPSSSPMQVPPPPKPSIAANLLQKLFGAKFASTQGSYGSEQQPSTSKADSRSSHESSHQIGERSNSSLSEMSRDAPSSRQHPKYGYDKQYTDGRDYELKRSPVNVRENPPSQSNLRSRYTLPERLPHARGNNEPAARYDRQPERELITYPKPRSDIHLRQDTPPARDMKAPYDSFQARPPVELRDSHREMRSARDTVPPRNAASLRDILPPRDNSPNSRDTLLPRDRAPRDHLQRDLPPRDVTPRNLPPHDISPRNLPPRDVSPRNLPPRDASPRNMPPRDASPRNMPPRDASPRNMPPRDASPRNMPPRDFPHDVSSRDMFPPRGMPPRDDRSARDPYIREFDNQREPFPYDNTPSRYQSSSLSSREALDRARFERSMGTGARDSRGDYPAYRGEPEPRFGRDFPSRESALGTMRGSPARYPMEGPQSKRPRY